MADPKPLTFAECRVGLSVVAPMDAPDPGTIESLEHRYGTVMVRFPVPGTELSDVLEYDPADLIAAGPAA